MVVDTQKLVSVGGGGVGKSSLTIQYIKSVFVSEYDPTIEDLYRKQVVVDGQTSLIDILDTSGQDEFSVLAEQWYRNGDGFLLVYSITSRTSFEEISSTYAKIRRCQDKHNVPAVLVGNKSDLEAERAVSTAEGRVLAREMGIRFIETSALHKTNVDDAYIELIRAVRSERYQDARQLRKLNRKRDKRCAIV